MLAVTDVAKSYRTGPRSRLSGLRAPRTVLHGATFELGRAETLAIVGESGSGKSTLGRIALGDLAADGGQVLYHGNTLASLDRVGRLAYRRNVQAIFQDASAALNPRRTVGESVETPLRHTLRMDRLAARRRAEELLDSVGLDGAEMSRRFPFELSGGQRQRAVIARALALDPEVIVADEPVSALDAAVRGVILSLLADLQSRLGVSYLFISHDLGLVRSFAHRVVVMHHGRIVEQGPVERVFDDPKEDYTRRLLAATPRMAIDPAEAGLDRTQGIAQL